MGKINRAEATPQSSCRNHDQLFKCGANAVSGIGWIHRLTIDLEKLPTIRPNPFGFRGGNCSGNSQILSKPNHALNYGEHGHAAAARTRMNASGFYRPFVPTFVKGRQLKFVDGPRVDGASWHRRQVVG
jgi:hypothetical protein